MDKMERESEERLAVTLPARHSSSRVKCQTVATDDVSPGVAASFSQNSLLGSTSSLRIVGLPQICLTRVLRSIAATSGPRLTLATVCHSPLLPPANGF